LIEREREKINITYEFSIEMQYGSRINFSDITSSNFATSYVANRRIRFFINRMNELYS